MTEPTIVRIKCGEIFLLANDVFSLICKFCGDEFHALEEIRIHIAEHFPESPNNINEDSVSSGSDCMFVSSEICVDFEDDFIGSNLQGDEDTSQSADIESGQLLLLNDKETSETNGSVEIQRKRQSNGLRDVQVQKEVHYTPRHRGQKPSRLTCNPSDDIYADSDGTNDCNNETEVISSNENDSDCEFLPSGIHENVKENLTEIKSTEDDCDLLNIVSGSSRLDENSFAEETSDIRKNELQSKENNSSVPEIPNVSRWRSGCRFCGKIFKSKHKFDNHENIHTGNRPYECRICSKTFAAPTNLSAHIQVHTNDRRHKCEVCDKKFINKTLLDRHTRENHLPDTHPRRYFPCKLCDFKLKTYNQLRMHTIRQHERIVSIDKFR